MSTNTDSLSLPAFWAPAVRETPTTRPTTVQATREQVRARDERERAWERQARMLAFFNLR